VTILETETFSTSTTLTLTTTPLEVEELAFTSNLVAHCLPADIAATMPVCI
jgi:hypothetical protein